MASHDFGINPDPNLDFMGAWARGSLLVEIMSSSARTPYRANPSDVGLDLYVSRAAAIAPGQLIDVHADVATALPPNTWGFIFGRSSTAHRRNLLVIPSVIDPGYRGELFAMVYNFGQDTVKVEVGERLSQLVLMDVGPAQGTRVVVVDTVPGQTDRGVANLGSSGV